MKLTRVISLLISMSTISTATFADDMIIMRNGNEIYGKLDVISERDISFYVKRGSLFNREKEIVKVPTNDVYMIKTDKRGTVFFDRNRTRSMSESIQIPKGADVIYLIDGGEIPAWQLSISNGVISYQKDAKGKKALSSSGAEPMCNVFMIKYSDGSKDIFNDITASTTQVPVDNTPTEEKKIKVIMHTVKKGESLSDIIALYDVTLEQIIEWNDLSTKSTDSTQLSVGTQLMIQTHK